MLTPVTHRSIRWVLGFFFALSLSGCTAVRYYGQAIEGQWKLLAARQPVDQVLADPATSAETRQLLGQVDGILRYATSTLALPDNGSYRSYVDLGRPNVVWNVTATPEFSLQPITHCFPIVGCLAYRGFFSEEQARNYADSLKQQGMDVYVSTATAFSSLGWFRDPILNTMLRWDETRLAEVIFHELAHQRLYVKDDSAFSEAFAMAVQRAGVRQWLRANHGESRVQRYDHEAQQHQAFIQLLLDARRSLAELYALDIQDVATLRRAKAEKIRQLRSAYATWRARQGGEHRYDGWFDGDINNARLALVGTYNEGSAAFDALLTAVHGELPSFYRAAELKAALPQAQRQRWLSGRSSP